MSPIMLPAVILLSEDIYS